MTKLHGCLAITVLACVVPLTPSASAAEPELVSVRKIWDAAPHNAFTDLIRFKDQWFCAFREGKGHVSDDGAVRVLVSDDGQTWKSAAVLRSPDPQAYPDLRDAKLAVVPDGRLLLTSAIVNLNKKAKGRCRSVALLSDDGLSWSAPAAIGLEDSWLWGLARHEETVYSIGYETRATLPKRPPRLYRSTDGKSFKLVADLKIGAPWPTESSIVFTSDGTAHCLHRCDGADNAARVGTSRPPYTDWSWKKLKYYVGGPKVIQLPDGRFLGCGRLKVDPISGKTAPDTTWLFWVDFDAGSIDPLLKLPSGGDTSYPGMVQHGGLLWISYYSSHEGKTSIYLAKVKME